MNKILGLNVDELIEIYPENFLSTILRIQGIVPERSEQIQHMKYELDVQIKEMEDILTRLLWTQLHSIGLFKEKKSVIADLKTKTGLRDLYDRWLDESIAVLIRKKYLQSDGTSITLVDTESPDIEAVWEEWNQKKSIWFENSNLKARVVLVEETLRSLPEILTGQRLATDIMFPNSSMELVEEIYKNDIVADYFNEVLADVVVGHIQERVRQDSSVQMRILEIGAGTGGTSAMLFRKLKAYHDNIQEYCYTDISKAFLMHAEKEYAPENSYLTCKIFNVEKPVMGQGIDAGGYDIAIATNVLHATKNIRNTLRNTKAALKKNGIIVVNELTENSLFAHLTFGLLEGWWLYEDAALRIPGSPILHSQTWQAVLESEGFRGVFFPAVKAEEMGQQIIAAESDGFVRQKQSSKPSAASAAENRRTSQPYINPSIMAPRNRSPVTEAKPDLRGADATQQMVGDYVKEIIIEKLSKSLKVDSHEIDGDESFADYGLDSITGVQLVQVINETLMIELETTSLFDYSSVNQLTSYILSSFKDVIGNNLTQNEKHAGFNDKSQTPDIYEEIPQYANPKPLPRRMELEEPDIKKAETKGALIEKEPIAIIGMSGRFAKSKTVNDLWNHLSNGKDLVEEVSRWDMTEYPEGKEHCKYGSFLEDIDQFDPLFFKISGLEATYMDPQQRVFMEESWKALEDAGYAGKGVQGRLCGVYVGCTGGDYEQLFGDNPPAQAFWGNAGSVIPARIAYYLDLQGPAVAVDTACSSSLVAIHLACQGLWAGETEMALAGGVFIQSTPEFYLKAGRAGMLSPTGRCQTFDDTADGFIPGEGVGVVALKRLNEAVADGDHIYGVIRGTGINQDGTTNGITAPSAKSQERLETFVYDEFNINPEQIQMVEAHGTGTKLGDPIEYQALTRSFRKYTDKKEYSAIGSIKTNIGHAIAAAGVAGLIKILLSLKHKQIPPSLHFQSGNSNIRFKDSPFYVNTTLKEWSIEPGSTRRAVLSSFGFSGTNAHMVIEEAPAIGRRHAEKPGYLITLSAYSLEQLQQQVRQLVEYCEREPQADCGNISYTLLLGRKHCNFRLVCVIRDINELVSLLNRWLETGKVPQIYVSDLDETDHREKISLKHYGNQCIEKCQYTEYPNEYLDLLSSIAELFSQGYELEFENLFINDKYSRLSLPTYPFSGERYWISDTKKSINLGEIGQGQRKVLKLHPLVDRNVSTLHEQKFATQLTGEEFYLSHHIVDGQMILPGVAFIEMVRAAAEIAGEKHVGKLKDIVWLRPVILRKKSQEIYISLYPNQDSEIIDFEISSTENDGRRLVHAQGQLTYEDAAQMEVNNEQVDIAGIKQRCTEQIDVDTCYDLFWNKGLHLGPGFRVMQQLNANEREVLTLLKVPQELEEGFNDFVLHPSLMDGSLQSGIGLRGREENSTLYLPFTMGELEVLGPLPRKCYGHVVVKGNTGNEKYDIRVIDEAGNVLVKIKDFVARPYLAAQSTDTEATIKNEQSARMYFRGVWERKEISDITGKLLVPPGNIIIFDHGRNIFDAVKDRLARVKTQGNDARVFLVKPGDAYQNLGDNIYQINPGSMVDYQQLFKDLKLQEWLHIRIIHNWSQGSESENKSYDNREDINSQLDEGIYSFMNLSQALMQQRIENKVELLYLFPGNEDGPLPHHAAVNGFVKTIPVENARFICKTVELRGGGDTPGGKAQDSTQIVDLILNELQTGIDKGVEVSYRGGQRWVKVWKEFDMWREAKELLPLKEKGVYLITGGMGGLGFTVAKYLAQKVKARIVLVGRSELDSKGQAKIKELESLGSEVEYIKADVSKLKEAQHIVKKSKTRFKSINGIIHSAGITRDSFLQNKTREDVEEVLAPKVYGTINLDRAAKGEKLDFFVMFSSLSSIMGNAGQCDYAYANSFMDHYSIFRENLRKSKKRFGKTYAINWPLWKDGGLKVDDETEELIQNTLGLKLLDSTSGLEIFEAILTSVPNQIMVLEGEPDKVRQIVEEKLNLDNHKDVDGNGANIGIPVDGNDLLTKISKDLVKMVSSLSKVEQKRINVLKSLTEYGFDSISFVNFTNQINKEFNLNLSPAVFFEYPSIDKLSQHFYKDHYAKISRYYAADTASTVKAAITMVDEKMSFRRESKEKTRFKTWDFGKKQDEKVQHEPIAIVGMSGVMPQSEDLDSFWANLEDGRDLITKVPEDRWEWGRFEEALANENDPNRAIWGGFIKDVDKFDAPFFGISPREAELMDPQQRIFLETVWKTIEDAGYRTSALSGTKTGLFVGVSTTDYGEILRQNEAAIEGHLATGLAHSVLANRISYLFNFHGPSEPVDTACSSALVAVHRAVESIWSGSCEMAIAGGVNVLITPTVFISFMKAGMLSPDGRCKTFDKRANGYVRGEGAGAVFLKPLSRAVNDGDHIYAVIKSTAINHGGHSSSLTAPSMIAQSDLLIEVYEKAAVDPTTISYIEAHGTGTSLGDPIEVDGLKRAFSELHKRRGLSPQKGYCGLGAVKTNIGHLEAAAGIAGLLKVLLAMKYKKIPANVHFKELNPYIRVEDSPFYIVSETKPWEKLKDKENKPIPRRAGISSFGFGGANAHIMLEEYESNSSQSNVMQEPQIIVLSARNEERLKAYAEKMVKFLEQCSSLNLRDVAYTLQVGREAMEKRVALVASSIQEAKEKLIQFCHGDANAESETIFTGNLKESLLLSNFLLEGNEGKQYLNIIIQEKKLEKLAKIWVMGVEVDWELLYRGQTPNRISLPTYPFAREQHWIEIKKSVGKAVNVGSNSSRQQDDNQQPWRNILLNHDSDQRMRLLESFLNEQVSRILKLSSTQALDSKQPLVTLGLDSLMALQLKKQIETQLDLDVSVIQFLGGDSTADLAARIMVHLDGKEEGICTRSAVEETAAEDDLQDDLIEGVL